MSLVNLFDVMSALEEGAETRAVYLFGSTARQLRTFVSDDVDCDCPSLNPEPSDFASTSNDYDLVVTVSAEVYEAWNAQLIYELGCEADCELVGDAYHGCKWVRFNLALKLLGCGTYHESSVLYRWLATLDRIKEIDIHLMPEDWQSRPGELQEDLPHNDENFVQKIATDAVSLTTVIKNGWPVTGTTYVMWEWSDDLIGGLGDEYRSQQSTATV